MPLSWTLVPGNVEFTHPETVQTMKTLHLSKYPPRMGGMDYLLRLHESAGETVSGLLKHDGKPSIGLKRNLSFFFQRRALQNLIEVTGQHEVSIYYNCWGADIFSSYDRATLRIGYLHNHFPGMEHYIRHFGKFLDGFITVHPDTTQYTRTLLAEQMPLENIQTVQLPITPVEDLDIDRKENIIGMIGRINYEQKRFDRLLEFAELLRETMPDYQIEILGDGPKLKEVQRQTAHLQNIRFIPWAERKTYWQIISRWKYVLFLSDYEGLPVSLLEATHAGCIGIYPDFHNGSTAGLPIRLYQPGDLREAINQCTQTWSPPAKTAHTNESTYLRSLKQAIQRIKPRETKQIPLSLHINSISYNRAYKRLCFG